MNSEDDPLYAIWGYNGDGELYMAFFREPPQIEVTPSCGNVFADLGLPDAEERLREADRRIILATPDDVALDPAVVQRLAYWKWRQAHGLGEFDLEYEAKE